MIANGTRKFGPVEPHNVFTSAGEWVINSGTTPTAQTGPNNAHSGSNYLYAENSPLFAVLLQDRFGCEGGSTATAVRNY